MTADAAHVAAVAEALFARGQVACEFHGGTLYDECASCCGLVDELHRDATVAVETLMPLIRAQVAAEILAQRDRISLAGSVLDRAARGWEAGYLDAARIVEGESRPHPPTTPR